MSQNNKKATRKLPFSAPRRHNNHRLIWIFIFAILTTLAIIILINVFKPISFKDKKDFSDATTSDTIKSENVKGESSSKDASGKSESSEAPEQKSSASDGTPLTDEGPNPNSSDSLTGAITFSGISEGTFMIRTNIDQYLSSGICNLTLSSNSIPGVSYTQQVNIIPSVSSSTCDGFDYDASEIRPGNYSIKIEITSGEKTNTLTGEVNL